MTLRQLINNLLFPRLLKDINTFRLSASASSVYLSLYYFPMQSISDHAARLGWAKSTIRRAIYNLIDINWVYMTREKGPHRSDLFVPSIPPEVESEITKHLLNIRNDVPYIGEWLMRCLLDLIVADKDFWDNARPPWLVTQDGSGRLEIDRWYRSAAVAIEFQGSQHYRTGTDFATSDAEVNRQMMRDNIKAGICQRHNISFVEISGLELTPYVIQGKVKDLLPVFPINESGPIFSTLTKMCRSYVNSAIRSEKHAFKQTTADTSPT